MEEKVKKKTTVDNSEFEIKEIYNNPLSILHDKKLDEWWLILGNEKVKKFENELGATIAANQYDWDMLGPVMMTIARHVAIDVYNNLNNNNLNKN